MRMFLWWLCLFLSTAARAEPPYSGTIFLDPDIITSSDPTTYSGLTYTGRGNRVMFARRVNAFVTYNASLFNAFYSDGLQIEFQVNPEYGSVASAQVEVALYAPVIGRLPRALRANVLTGWVHRGDEAFGGGNQKLLIHTGSIAQGYIADGILEEAFVHEASHSSLDGPHAASSGWLAAQQSDAEFISTYARDNPTREDVAETFLVYLAARCRSSRVPVAMVNTIEATVPARLDYFESAQLALAPVVCDWEVFRNGFETP